MIYGSIEGRAAGGDEGGGTLIYFTEDNDARELGVRIARDDGVVEVNAWDCSADV